MTNNPPAFSNTKKLVLSAFFLALGLVLPFLTGQIPEIGNMISPMHFPVMLCGFICGGPYGALVGLILPPLRFLLFQMPPLFPTEADREDFNKRHHKEHIHIGTLEGAHGPHFLGIDAGSTTIKATLVNDDREIVWSSYANNEGCKKAAVIMQNGDDYSTGLANYFADAFAKMDGCEVVYTGTYNTNETDFNAILTAAKAADPDVLFIPSSITTAGIIIKQARDMGITARIMAGDTWENATIMENAGVENCEGVALSTFFDENDADASEFVQGFKAYLNGDAEALKLNGNNDTVAAVSALGYDAYMAIIEALKNVSGDITGEAVRDALASVSFDGVTGSISFDENGDAKKDTAFIKEMADGAFKFLGTQKTDGSFNAAN